MEEKHMAASVAAKIRKKERYTIDDLLRIMSFLRSEHGCPWDREQTHDSIKGNVVEEAYEVVEAIDGKDPDRIADELGDVLLQVVFHSQMASESGDFDFSIVVKKICDKLLSRHTHLFGGNGDSADTAESVIALWDRNKRKEKNHVSHSQAMKEVPGSFPALMRAHKIQKKAAGAGFDWKETADVAAKVEEEFAEVREAAAACSGGEGRGGGGGREKVEDEIGDLFFAMVNYARFLHVDPELALDKANRKFIRRFEAVEGRIVSSGRDMKEMSLEELDSVWDEVKADEREARDEA